MVDSIDKLSEEERAFLQYRVSRFGLYTSLVFLGFLAFRLIMEGDELLLQPLSFVFHLAAALSFLGIWGLTARSSLREPLIRWIETCGLLVGALFIMAMGHYIPVWAQPKYILLLATTYAVMMRSVYVPSSARRTLLLCLWIGIELVVSIYWIMLSIDVEKWRHFDPIFRQWGTHEIASTVATNAAAWWAATTITTTATSSVIYGLRRNVRAAEQLGQYTLEEKLGEGGMGVVYRARHALLRRPTAVKLLQPDRIGTESLARFEREVTLMSQLRHPNTVTIFDYGHTPDGVFYYAMELVDGATLSDIVEQTGPMDFARVVHLVRQVASALVEAHGAGLIHRDIKPANIMAYLPHGFGSIHESAKILDFGLVKESSNVSPGITRAGIIAGTPQYMSPEAIEGIETLDGRSDIYSLGCVAYFLLTGSHVSDGRSSIEICSQHLRDPPKPPSSRIAGKIPSDLEHVVMRCLEKDPQSRPQAAGELEDLLHSCSCDTEYSVHDAQEWWAEYRTLFAEDPRIASVKLEALTIDLARAPHAAL